MRAWGARLEPAYGLEARKLGRVASRVPLWGDLWRKARRRLHGWQPSAFALKRGRTADVHTIVRALRPGREQATRSRTSLDETIPDRRANKAVTGADAATLCLPELPRAPVWTSRLTFALCSTLLLLLLGLTTWLVAEPVLAARRLERPIALSIGAASLLALLGALVFLKLYLEPLLRRTERVCNQLQLTTDSALSAARRERDLLAHVSHELRTPLNAMLGSIELLARSELEPVPRKYTSALQLSADALIALLDDVLDFAKLEAGMFALRSEVCTVSRLLEDVCEVFGARAQLANLRVTCRVAADVPARVELDGPRVQQALANLVSNAVKYSRGEVAIEAVRLAGTAERVLLRFSVFDSGTGVSEQDRARLFCAFSQLDGPTTHTGGGTGLGLAISKQLVETMGGCIGVESNVGEGSRFWFELSARVVSEGMAAGPARAKAPRTLPLSPHLPRRTSTRARLLIAEDDPINQLVLVALLDQLGYDADVVADGRQALEMATAGNYPLLLLDCRLPELDGYETARRIRRREGSVRRLAIVALTADTSAGQAATALEAGMDESLCKPIRLALLDEMLRRWCPRPERELTSAPPLEPGVGALAPVNGRSAAVTRLFFEHAPAQLARMQRAVADAQPGELADAVHRLKGSCFAIGAQRLAELCAELEASPDRALTTLATLAHEYTRFETEQRALTVQPNDRARQLFDAHS